MYTIETAQRENLKTKLKSCRNKIKLIFIEIVLTIMK